MHRSAAIALIVLAGCPNEREARKDPAPAAISGEPAAKPPAKTKLITIHPQPGQTDCVEMYGTCTEPPDRLCTSTAFVLGCGETGQRPTTHEWLECRCP